MKRTIQTLFCSMLLGATVHAQNIPVITPAASVPKLVIPATFQAKLKVVDSLQKANTSAGAILKAFLPQYTVQFQDKLIESLLLIDQSKKPNGDRYTIAELINVVRVEYPSITRAAMTKIFFTFYTRMRFVEQFELTPWVIEWSLNKAYGSPLYEQTGPRFLKEANVSLQTIFAYYANGANLATSSLTYYSTVDAEIIKYFQIKDLIYKILIGGFTPEQIYPEICNAGYRNEMWLVNFCYANALFGTPVERLARILKNNYVNGDQLTYILGKVPEYNKPDILLRALQAN